MIEKTVYDWLTAQNICTVYMELPESLSTAPERFLLVEKTGGGQREHIKSAMITVQSYAASLLGAAQLNEAAKAAMEGIIELDEVCSCSLNSDHNYTDDRLKRYRYQAVFDIVHY